MKYFVNKGANNLGPFDIVKIRALIKSGELSPSDKMYLAATDQWVAISAHPEFNQPVAKPAKPELAPLPAAAPVKVASVSNVGQWFVLKGTERKGPFTFFEVVKMLQEKSIFEYDYANTQGLEGWTRIAEIPEFAAENIRRVMKSDLTKNQNVFAKRKSPRIVYECAILAHDNKSYWAGYTLELGEEGAGVVIENAMIMPGQNIYLHFKAGPQTKAFNVLCEVVSKKFIKNIRDKHTPMIYGVKFINIPKQEKDLIKSLSA